MLATRLTRTMLLRRLRQLLNQPISKRAKGRSKLHRWHRQRRLNLGNEKLPRPAQPSARKLDAWHKSVAQTVPSEGLLN